MEDIEGPLREALGKAGGVGLPPGVLVEQGGAHVAAKHDGQEHPYRGHHEPIDVLSERAPQFSHIGNLVARSTMLEMRRRVGAAADVAAERSAVAMGLG